jgi:hypothetical protein
MRYIVSILSWVACISFSFLFKILLAFADDTGANYTNARAAPFLWVAGLAVVVTFVLLLLDEGQFTWLPWAASAFPWCAYPWLAAAFPALTYGPPPETGEWVDVGASMGCIFFVLSVIAGVVRRRPHLGRVLRGIE